MISKKIPFFFALLFLISIPATFIFWTAFSDRAGIPDEDERAVATFLNENFKEGDTIFPSPGWDIGFTRYLRDGITDISYRLTSYRAGELADLLKTSNAALFFVLDNGDKWDSISSNHKLKAVKSVNIGSSLVVKAVPKEGREERLLDFATDIQKAEAVYLLDSKGTKHECKLMQERWQCSSHSWNYVGKKSVVIEGRKRLAVWAHPRSGKTLAVRFALPSGSKSIVLGTAFLERAYRASGDPVSVKIKAGAEELLSYTNENLNKYYRNRIELPAGADHLELLFHVKNDGARHFVFNGYISKQ